MHGRYWVHVIAAGLLAVSICGGSLAQQPVPEQRERNGSAASNKSTTDKQDPTATLAPLLKGIEAAIRESKAEEDKAERESQRDREAADLEAQQDMARWAFWMFIANAATVVLTFAALIAILRTLHHTRRAADSGQQMAEQAVLSTNAAIEAANATNATANLMLQVELPIVVVSDIQMFGTHDLTGRSTYSTWAVQVPSEHNVVPRIHIRNFGKTPAILYEIALGSEVCRGLEGAPKYTRLMAFDATDVVRPEPRNDPFIAEVVFQINATADEIERMRSREAFLWLFGAIRLRDFMGARHEFRFCWRWAQRPEGQGRYHFGDDGNSPPAFIGRSRLNDPA